MLKPEKTPHPGPLPSAEREGTKIMIRKLDKLWFRLLGMVHRWTIRRGQAYCDREKLRQFRRFINRQNPRLN